METLRGALSMEDEITRVEVATEARDRAAEEGMEVGRVVEGAATGVKASLGNATT